MFEKVMAEVIHQMVTVHFDKIPGYNFMGTGSVQYRDNTGDVNETAVWWQTGKKPNPRLSEPSEIEDESFPTIEAEGRRQETPFTRYGIAIDKTGIDNLNNLDEQLFSVAETLKRDIHQGMWAHLLSKKEINHIPAASPWGKSELSKDANPIDDIAFGNKPGGYKFTPSVAHMSPRTHRLLYDAMHLRCTCCGLHGSAVVEEMYGTSIAKSLGCPDGFCFLFSRSLPQVQAMFRVNKPITFPQDNYIETRWNPGEKVFEIYVDVAFVIYEPDQIVIIETSEPESTKEEE